MIHALWRYNNNNNNNHHSPTQQQLRLRQTITIAVTIYAATNLITTIIKFGCYLVVTNYGEHRIELKNCPRDIILPCKIFTSRHGANFSNHIHLEHFASVSYHPIYWVIAHTRLAGTRCMTGVQPNLALVEWRTVQMHCYRGHGFAWVPNLVIPIRRGLNGGWT